MREGEKKMRDGENGETGAIKISHIRNSIPSRAFPFFLRTVAPVSYVGSPFKGAIRKFHSSH